jgi:repressor LexA
MSKTLAGKTSSKKASVQRAAAGKSAGKRPVASAAALRSVASLQNGLLQKGFASRTADGTAVDGEDAPTERQMEIYSFIRDKIHSRGYGPTVREIGTAFKIRSPNGVVCHLKALERKGLITRGKNMSRAIELVAEPAHLRGLPLAGLVAAGTLRPAEEQSERIDFETLFKRDNHFVLKVMGDSMIDAQIADGDWVVIQKKQTAHSGDIVVAQTEDGEATLKHWFPERDRIRLQPANAGMKPIYVKNARVLGVRRRRRRGPQDERSPRCATCAGIQARKRRSIFVPSSWCSLVQLVVERLETDAEFFGSADLVAVVAFKPFEDCPHL